MSGTKGPIEDAYYDAIYKRLFSMVYFALNEGVAPKYRRSFRRDWTERGSYLLGELLLLSSRPDWESHPDTFWVDPWIAKHLLEYESGSLCFIVDRWLAGDPLPPTISEDPREEDSKVRELRKLFSALNNGEHLP